MMNRVGVLTSVASKTALQSLLVLFFTRSCVASPILMICAWPATSSSCVACTPSILAIMFS